VADRPPAFVSGPRVWQPLPASPRASIFLREQCDILLEPDRAVSPTKQGQEPARTDRINLMGMAVFRVP
jgi:hypothetical protein